MCWQITFTAHMCSINTGRRSISEVPVLLLIDLFFTIFLAKIVGFITFQAY